MSLENGIIIRPISIHFKESNSISVSFDDNGVLIKTGIVIPLSNPLNSSFMKPKGFLLIKDIVKTRNKTTLQIKHSFRARIIGRLLETPNSCLQVSLCFENITKYVPIPMMDFSCDVLNELKKGATIVPQRCFTKLTIVISGNPYHLKPEMAAITRRRGPVVFMNKIG